mmetsp:Transcript_19432/g.41547  ORF Transcript_19432/g.41547 Transcript_19432/m.41547 type:complete len:621 (+) Transcript_19432:69-1931(+)
MGVRERILDAVTGVDGHHRKGKNSSSKTSKDIPPNNSELSTSSHDEMFLRLRREAVEVVKREPILSMLLSKAGLLDASTLSSLPKSDCRVLSSCVEPARSFEEVISRIVSHKLSSCSGGSENVCPKFLCDLLLECFNGNELEMGHTMSEAVREDALAIVRRDPACETLLEAVLFMKGFHSLVLHRAARRAWKPEARRGSEASGGGDVDENGDGNDAERARGAGPVSGGAGGKRFVALLLQSQSSSALGVDIHPASSIGKGVMIDHASGVVIGETATVGDGTTILHGVTLGGTGKDHGVDRHPKIGKDVLIGAGTKILGNITVGDRAKIGAGSVVLRPIPSGATAVGAPAKIIGYTPRGERPGSDVDVGLKEIEPLLGKRDSSTEATAADSSGSLATLSSAQAKEKGDQDDEDDKEEPAGSEEEEGAHNKESSSDDDNVTDFGTPAKCRYVKVLANDGLCPFRGSFRGLPSTLKDCISHSQLRALLTQEGCTEGECVEVFFALLHRTPATSKARQCGSIPCEVFSSYFPEVAREKTKLDEETIRALASGDLRALGMSKKASRRFRSVFSELGRLGSSGKLNILARIPSSGALREDNPIRKSERQRMTDHLDTDSYAEGITI